MSDSAALQAWTDAALAPWRLLLQSFALVPQSLTQPINPGWTFGNLIQVTEQNSSAPDTESQIVSRHSYGRQIGRLMDAVELLLERVDDAARSDARAQDFIALQRDVQAIKQAQAAAHLRRLRDELVALRRDHPDACRELRALLDE
ncbi:MAG TPA: hypothetical protein VFK10_04235 [Burkholderiaceae bacterium]|nr:hypothetical protein [Burkholderiaceae bacterium]